MAELWSFLCEQGKQRIVLLVQHKVLSLSDTAKGELNHLNHQNFTVSKMVFVVFRYIAVTVLAL